MDALSLDTVCNLILRARSFDVKVEPVLPDDGSNPIDDGDQSIIESLPDDAGEQELRQLIEDLNEDEQTELVALAWVGRGSFTAEEWQEAMTEARQARNGRTADYLLGLPLLGDYLEEGLAAFGLSCVG
jgi:hypothetical protein